MAASRRTGSSGSCAMASSAAKQPACVGSSAKAASYTPIARSGSASGPRSSSALRKRNPAAQALVWLPIKDLETLDSFLRDLEDEAGWPLQVAECRVKPLDDPMKMNGCALVVANGPDLDAPLAAICGWIAQALGAGGAARTYRLAPQ